MRHLAIVTLGVALVLPLGGCATRTGTTTLAGTGIGAASGAVIGALAGNAAMGTAIGAGAGMLGGFLYGKHEESVDKAYQEGVKQGQGQR